MAKVQKNRYQLMGKVNLIVTHPRPHLDEIAALWLLYQYGDKMFPGVEQANIEIWGDNGWCKGKSPEDCEREGILLLGVGGGRFDEHPDPVRNTSGRPGECVTTLVAKELGVIDDPPLRQLINFVAQKDIKGVGNGWDLGTMINLMHEAHPDNPVRVINWAMEALFAQFDTQRKFFACGPEFDDRGRVLEVQLNSGDKVKIAVVESDNPKMGAFCRSRQIQAAVVIQRRSTGHVVIFPNSWHQKNMRLSLVEVVRVLRILEQEFAGRVITTNWRTLENYGTVPGVANWYFQENSQLILNGSLARDEVKPTVVPFKLLANTVANVLNRDSFEGSRAKQCRRGTCSHNPQSPCRWHKWGLDRCRVIRGERID